ncbi:MAG: universal stress protein [Rhodospirillales bacterium]|nr:MAG: universal stress protein [Rhodospirillales bacterium]
MPVKDLLVHIDHGRASPARLDAAIALAAAHDAHLVGLYVLSRPHIPGFIRTQIPPVLLKHQEEALGTSARQAEEHFNDAVRRAGVKGEWRCVDGDPEPVLSLHARYCDLCVVGQRDPEGEDATMDPAMPDRLILTVGRPVLVVPKVGDYPVIGKRVLVAWDASRLATRAVNDALPILTAADHVSVLAVNPRGGEDGHGDIPSADICLHLARHGIKAEAEHVYADDVDVGAMLLSTLAAEGADLLVMGAYGHTRWRELVLGGATRHILEHMTVPVLMSH